MLGELIAEEHGKITGTRVLPSAGPGPTIEVSFSASGQTLGIDTTDMGTYITVPRPDGLLYGEGQGVIMAQDGDMVTWKGQGIGRPTGGGAVSWRGAVYYQTASEKLARLNGIAGIFEFETDASGNSHAKLWEWK